MKEEILKMLDELPDTKLQYLYWVIKRLLVSK